MIDTTDSLIRGDVAVDLKTEAIDMELEADPKDPSPFALQSPIKVTGPLKDPNISVNIAKTGLRAAAATVLGIVLTPAAAIIPYIEPGLGKDSDCNHLISVAEQQAE